MKKILLVLAVLAVGATTASAQKVRVMSYNVHNCIGSDKVKDIDRCANVILEANPDIVAIQEVDSCTRRNKRYVLGELGEKAGYHAYFGPTIPYKGGKYGIAPSKLLIYIISGRSSRRSDARCAYEPSQPAQATEARLGKGWGGADVILFISLKKSLSSASTRVWYDSLRSNIV